MIKASKNKCANMNHGKAHPPIRFCPGCGEKFNSGISAGARCDAATHAARRKDRSHFCHDCGKDLLKAN
jgi:hypothetical protein